MDLKLKNLLDFVNKKFGKVDVILDFYSMKIVWVSTIFAKNLGYKQNELIGEHPKKVLSINYFSVISAKLGKKKGKYSQELITKSGEKKHCFGSVQQFNFEDEPYFVFKMIKI